LLPVPTAIPAPSYALTRCTVKLGNCFGSGYEDYWLNQNGSLNKLIVFGCILFLLAGSLEVAILDPDFIAKTLVGAGYGTVVSFLVFTFSLNYVLPGSECTMRDGMAAVRLVLTSRAGDISRARFEDISCTLCTAADVRTHSPPSHSMLFSRLSYQLGL
jgi:hypothetical protein